jgi:tRNA U34 5-carboxymethylaminomethyl modifying GTPase MnmE/TrmE
MELELDFSEEEVEFADRSRLNTLLEALVAHTSRLIDSFKLGNAIKNGVPVAIAGATNTGKSTLLNALLGEDRAIVSDVHGTTRDTIEETLNIDGVLFRFIDTAGLRETDEVVEKIGIESYICASDVLNHAWNIITLGGKRYHMDATFDNTLSKNGVKRHDYYNLDDKRIFRDHRALLYPVPQCTDADGFFYRTEKRSFTKKEDVEKRIDQMCRKKRETFVFHWRGGYLTREVLSDLCRRIEQAAAKRERGVEIFVNWPQAVLQVRFTDQKPMTVTDEDAGEDVQ